MATTTTTTTTSSGTDHGLENAIAWAARIEAWHEAVEFLREGSGSDGEPRELSREARAAMHEHGWKGDNKEETAEAIEGTAMERALSVEYRSAGWSSNGNDLEPDEYRILLATGGPALQITGGFDVHQGATTVRLEHQDWWKPWTEYREVDEHALWWFVSLYCLADC